MRAPINITLSNGTLGQRHRRWNIDSWRWIVVGERAGAEAGLAGIEEGVGAARMVVVVGVMPVLVLQRARAV